MKGGITWSAAKDEGEGSVFMAFPAWLTQSSSSCVGMAWVFENKLGEVPGEIESRGMRKQKREFREREGNEKRRAWGGRIFRSDSFCFLLLHQSCPKASQHCAKK